MSSIMTIKAKIIMRVSVKHDRQNAISTILEKK
uniref:Uncharacterized protein n=1 Tax=Musa acuminata subsp. malaccensis TaxID=214687 RepID=A0A804HM25_MUSAM